MSIQLDDLVARLRLDTSGLRSSMGQVDSTLSSVGGKATTAGKRMSLGLTAPLVGIGIASVNLAANFDKTMRQVAIATDGPSKALHDLALRMGAETAFSAGEAADAMLELAKGGMTAAQIQGGVLASTMKLATVGQVDLATASTYTTTALNQFQLQAKDADAIVVALAGAANHGTASVDSLAQGLGNVGGVAHNMGMSLQETAGTLSLLDQAGLKGAEGGTALRSMLNGLTPSSDKAKAAVADLGLSFTDANGNFRSMADISQQLQDKLGGQTQAQRAANLETIFGTYGQQAANALMQSGAKGVEEYTKAARDQKTTQELANAAMEGTSGAMERAKGSIETAGIMIGTVLAPFVEKAAAMVERLANAFSSLSPQMQGILVGFGALAAVVGPLLIVFGMVASALGSIAGLFATTAVAEGAAAGATTALALPLVAVAALLVGLGAAFYIAYQRSAAFRAVVDAGMKAIRTSVAGMVSAVMPMVNQLVGVFRANLPQIRATAQQVFGSLRSIVQNAMSIVASVIRITTAVITKLWSVFGSVILSTINRVIPPLLQIIRGGFQIIQGIFQTVAAVLKGDWSGAWDGIKTITSGAMNVVKGLVRAGWALVRGAFEAGVKGAVAVVKGLGGLITSALAALGGAMYSAASALIQHLVDGVQDKIGDAVQAVQDGLSKIAGLLPGSPIKWGPLKSWNDGSPGRQLMEFLAFGIRQGGKTVQSALVGVTAGLFDGFDRQVGPIEQQVTSDVASLFERITTVYSDRSEAAQAKVAARFDVIRSDLEARQKATEARLAKQAKAADKTKTNKDDKRIQNALDASKAVFDKAMKGIASIEKQATARSVARYKAHAEAARKAISSITAALVVNAEQQDIVTEKLGAARDVLAGLQQQAADFAAGVRDSFVSFGSVVGLGVRQLTDSTTQTTADLLADLRAKVAAATRFTATIASLTAQGLNQTSIQQLVAAGVEGGLGAATAIAAGGPAAITEVNQLTADLAAQGQAMGATLSQTFYGTGIAAAQSVVDGLAFNQANLIAQAATLNAQLTAALSADMPNSGAVAGKAAIRGLVDSLKDDDGRLTNAGQRVARALVRAFRDELGIHSPSRVFGELGTNLVGSLIRNMDKMLPDLRDASKRLGVAAMIDPETLGSASAGLAAPMRGVLASTTPATAPVGVRVFIGDRELTDIVKVEVGGTLTPIRQLARQGV